jgi:hypothetical protein
MSLGTDLVIRTERFSGRCVEKQLSDDGLLAQARMAIGLPGDRVANEDEWERVSASLLKFIELLKCWRRPDQYVADNIREES